MPPLLPRQLSRFWLDYDIENATTTDSLFQNNSRDGLFIEASPGPVTVTASSFINNARYGVLGALSQQVSLDSLTVKNNLDCGIMFAADGCYPDGRSVDSFESGQTNIVTLKDCSLHNSVIIDDAGISPILVGTTLPANNGVADNWHNFVQTFAADYNRWINTATPNAFKLPASTTDLCGWRTATGQEGRSIFTPSILPCADANFPYSAWLPLVK